MQTTSPENAPFDEHLSQIATAWTVVFQAHAGPSEAVHAAQRAMLQRYSAAVYRYLLGAVRNPDVADDLFQEVALRFVRGDFKRADPGRGRFRDFLKTALYHLVVDYQRRQQRKAVPLGVGAPEPAVETSQADSDLEFLNIWRAELMNRAWQALAEVERQTGQVLYTVLRYRTDHPDVRSPQMAEQLAERLGKTVTGEWVRKRLHLAREKFTDLLVEEVARSVEDPTLPEIEHELVDLELLDYCRAALERRQQGDNKSL